MVALLSLKKGTMTVGMNLPTRLRLAVSTLFLVAFCTQSSAQWIKKPSDKILKQTPGLVHETFKSEAMKEQVGYSVILPPNYEASQKRYPVVYWLHGGGGNESSSLFTAKSWQKLYKSSAVNEAILVYPNGFRSGYMDHKDGKTMVESMIIKELIPRIDERFRTDNSRSGRAVHGFSMGASGSLKFAIKYPEMFCSAAAYGGGAIDLEKTKMPFVLKILESNLSSDPKLIRQNNTYHFLDENHQRVRHNGIEFLLICGEEDSWKESAVTFHEALKAKKISTQLKLVPKIGHDLKRLSNAEGAAAAIFQDRAFSRAKKQSSVD